MAFPAQRLSAPRTITSADALRLSRFPAIRREMSDALIRQPIAADVTPSFVRFRMKSPSAFHPALFAMIRVGSKGTMLVIGTPKAKIRKPSALSSFLRRMGWNGGRWSRALSSMERRSLMYQLKQAGIVGGSETQSVLVPRRRVEIAASKFVKGPVRQTGTNPSDLERLKRDRERVLRLLGRPMSSRVFQQMMAEVERLNRGIRHLQGRPVRVGRNPRAARRNMWVKPDAMVSEIIRHTFPGVHPRQVQIEPLTGPMSVKGAWDGGSRYFFAFYNLATGKSAEVPVQSHFDPQIRGADAVMPPPGVVIVEHAIVQGHDIGITIYARPEDLNRLALPAPKATITLAEQIVLMATSIKSSYAGISNYRFHHAHEETGISLADYEAAKASLIAKGLLNRAGAITIDGRNVKGAFKHHDLMSLAMEQKMGRFKSNPLDRKEQSYIIRAARDIKSVMKMHGQRRPHSRFDEGWQKGKIEGLRIASYIGKGRAAERRLERIAMRTNPRSRVDLAIRKTFQGAWAISAMVGGYRVERQYMGYTKREAIAMFRSYIKGIKPNPLTRKESASLLRSARQSAARAPHWHDPRSQHAEMGYAGGLVEAVRRCGPRGAKRASQVLFGRAKGWSRGEYQKHFGLNPRRNAPRRNPILATLGIAANPNPEQGINIPFRAGQKVKVEAVRRWLASIKDAATRNALTTRFEANIKQYKRFHLGSAPKDFTFQQIPLGTNRRITDVDFVTSEGKEWAASYQVPKHSAKYAKDTQGRYLHAHGDSGIDIKEIKKPANPKILPERFHTADGKFVGVIPKHQKITDWYRH
jgi:hypothetical protein